MVSADTEPAVPVIAPVEAFMLSPVGNAPDVIVYPIAPPSGSVAAAEKFAVVPSPTLPKLPAAFVNAGMPLYETAFAEVDVPPSEFVITSVYVPADLAGAVTVNCAVSYTHLTLPTKA